MKILLVTDDLFPGGISRHVVDLANGLTRNGHVVTVASAEGGYRTQLEDDVRYIGLPLMKRNTQHKSFWGFFRSYSILASDIAQNRYDIVHTHKRYVHFILSAIPQGRTTHITSYHTVFPGKHILSRFGDFTVCCSEAVRSSLIGRYHRLEESSCVVYNGISPLRKSTALEIRALRNKYSIKPTTRIVSSIGQFVSSKDKENLLKAIGTLLKGGDYPNVLFVLQGYGPLRETLRTQAAVTGIIGNILFLDESSPVAPLISMSEFMILNSKHSEGFGIVLLEGASLAKAHIGTSVGGIPEFIEHRRTGLLIAPNDHMILAESIRYLLEHTDECLEMGRRAKEKYEQHFRLDIMIASMLNVYQKVLASDRH